MLDNIKAIFGLVGAGVFLYFMLSILLAPTPDIAAEKAGDAVVHYAVPWWAKAVQFVVGIPVIGGLLAVGIIFYVAWNNR